jgi:hypothetical protein
MKRKLWVACGLMAASFWFGCDDPQKQKNFRQIDSTLQATRAQAELDVVEAQPLVVEVLTGDDLATLRDSLNFGEETYDGDYQPDSPPDNLAEDYKKGEPVLSELVEALRNGDEDQRRELLASLNNWYAPDGLPTAPPSLVEAVAQNLATTDTLTEMYAIGVLASFKPPGHVTLLEDRLLSGRSLNPALLVHWLGQLAPPDRTLGYIAAKLEQGEFPEADFYNIVSGLRSFAEKGDDAVRARVVNLCLRYLRQQWGQDYSAPTEGRDNFSLVELVATYGGPETLPLFRKLLTHPHHSLSALDALIRLEGKAHQKTVLAFLRNENHFSGALSRLEKFPAQSWDRQLGHYVLSQFSLHSNQSDYQVEQVAEALWAVGQRASLNQAGELLNNPKLGRQLRRYVAFNSASLDEMARSLYDLGLLARPIPAAALAQVRRDGVRGSQALCELLASTGRFQYTYDGDEYTHTELFAEVAKLAGQLLPGAELGVATTTLSEDDVEGSTRQYTLGLIYQQKGYRIRLPVGEYPSEQDMVALLDFVLADQGRPEGYVPIGLGSYPSGYLLGDEARVGVFKDKFGLDGGANREVRLVK